MTGVLLYQPNQRWRIGAALSAAALLHLAAIAFASIYPRERNYDVASTPGITELVFDSTPPVDDPVPPDAVAPTPSQDTTDKLFADENPTPPPVRRQDNKRAAPIPKTSNSSPGSLSLSSAKFPKMALQAGNCS